MHRAGHSRQQRGRTQTYLAIGIGLTILPAIVATVSLLDLQLGNAARWVVTGGTLATTVVSLWIGVNKLLTERASRIRVRRRRSIAVMAVGAYAAALAALVILQDPFASLPRLTGAQDIASIGFLQTGQGSPSQLEDLSEELVRSLRQSLPGVQVASFSTVVDPPLNGLLDTSGRSGAELDDWTLEFVARTGADIVVSGVVDLSGNQSRIRPAMYVRPALVPEAPELGGWILGPWSIAVGGIDSPRGRQSLLRTYLGSGVAVVTFVDALDAWRVGQITEASELLAGIDDATAHGLVTRDLLHLFRGHALQIQALRLTPKGDATLLRRAADEYGQIGPGSPLAVRGELSLATNAYLRAVGNECRAGTVDVPLLSTSIAALRRLSFEPSFAPMTRLTALVNFAQADYCAAVAGLPHDSAELTGALQQIREFPIPDETLSGLVHERQALGRSMEAQLAAKAGGLGLAGSLMRQAIDLTSDPVDRGRWWGFVALWEADSCALTGARSALEESLAQYRAAAEAGRIPGQFLEEYTAAWEQKLLGAEERCGRST